jgi:hypothetical protein
MHKGLVPGYAYKDLRTTAAPYGQVSAARSAHGNCEAGGHEHQTTFMLLYDRQVKMISYKIEVKQYVYDWE